RSFLRRLRRKKKGDDGEREFGQLPACFPQYRLGNQVAALGGLVNPTSQACEMVARPFPRVVFRHQLVGRVHAQAPKEHGSQLSPLSKAIKLRGDRSNCFATDLIAAPFVTEEVSPSANTH